MHFLFIKGDDASNVRLTKYFKCLHEAGHEVSFWGWDRVKAQKNNPILKKCKYMLRGGGFGGKALALLYPIWIIVVFFAILFRSTKGLKIIAVNFDSAFPTYVASLINRKSYIYEIHDEFSLSYNLPKNIKKAIQAIDHKVMRRAELVIHVDENRLTYPNCKTTVIENSPIDYFNRKNRDYDTMRHVFAVIGNISKTRGIDQICKFAKSAPHIGILLVGKFYDESLKAMLLSLQNVEYHAYMPQDELFPLLMKCCGIFSLYDPSLEINRLAASNKVYDAMMMGIPVITNKEVINSTFIREHSVGVVVNYAFDKTWKELSDISFLETAKSIGRNGRKLYVERYQFPIMVKTKLCDIL